MNRPLLALAAAAALLVAVPAWLLAPRAVPPPPPAVVPPPIVPAAAGAIDAALARDPFASADAAPATEAPAADAAAAPGRDAGPDDAPALAGIVGRLPDHVVVLVRRPGGGTRTLGLGESVDGWRLEAIAADAALFVRGERRVRVGVVADE